MSAGGGLKVLYCHSGGVDPERGEWRQDVAGDLQRFGDRINLLDHRVPVLGVGLLAVHARDDG